MVLLRDIRFVSHCERHSWPRGYSSLFQAVRENPDMLLGSVGSGCEVSGGSAGRAGSRCPPRGDPAILTLPLSLRLCRSE
jgi:hypothetical protein